MKTTFPQPTRLAASTIITLLLLLASGCANNAVYFTTMTRTGVEISAMDGGKQSAHVGFERFEGVLMPTVFTNASGETATLKQAYPVYAEYEYATGGLTAASANNGSALILRQVFATGRAATNQSVQRKVSEEFARLAGFKAAFKTQTESFASITNRFAALSPAGKLAVRNKAADLGLVASEGTNDTNFVPRLRRAVDASNEALTAKFDELDKFALTQ